VPQHLKCGACLEACLNPKLKLAAGYTSLALAALIGMTVGYFEGSLARRALAANIPIFSVLYGTDRSEFNGLPTPPEQVYRSVVSKIRHDYVSTNGQVTDRVLIAGALGRMMNSLHDERSRTISPTLAEAIIGTLHGKYQGIGATLAVQTTQRPNSDVSESNLRVISVVPGGPADRAGIRSGDAINVLDDKFVVASTDNAGAQSQDEQPSSRGGDTGILASHVIERICIGSGVSHTLLVQPAGSDASGIVELVTASESLPLIEQKQLNSGILMLRIRQISAQSVRELKTALSQPERFSKGLIVDLRQCSAATTIGGKSPEHEDTLLALAHLIGCFAPGEVAAQVEHRAGRKDPLLADPSTQRVHGPIAVFIDQGTAGLAECAAAALKEQCAATVIGQRSAGQDTLEEVCLLGTSAAIAFPCARLFTPEGHKLSSGITPAIPCAATDKRCTMEALRLFNREVVLR
jgi:carboxyl-terminal processing protease